MMTVLLSNSSRRPLLGPPKPLVVFEVALDFPSVSDNLIPTLKPMM